ncbi:MULTISPECIES: redoxin domain-containing protein [unclassified Roseateles]|uniref:redoxin domain-containing protein n=1 Tax=unclassified Roseateles TaxID=2626991 RepID=UPI0009EC5AD4|nr:MULTISPECIES: redoxin domain-containing protein [unclassified Roseateles]
MTLPELQASEWLNTREPLRLADLRGRVVVVHAFQMLCPACVSHGLPQMQRLQQVFSPEDVALIGLHSVFEHHDAMTSAALRAFVHEYRLSFPIAVDRPGQPGPLPQTMRALGLRGTPSLLVLDRAGRLRLHHFGAADDLALGALIGRLLGEPPSAAAVDDRPPPTGEVGEAAGCGATACAVPGR